MDPRVDAKKSQPTMPETVDIPQLLSGPSRRLEDMYDDSDVVDAEYRAKAHAVNEAMQDIGMGRYQVLSDALDAITASLMHSVSGACGLSRASAILRMYRPPVAARRRAGTNVTIWIQR
jgi:hypothetical protein